MSFGDKWHQRMESPVVTIHSRSDLQHENTNLLTRFHCWPCCDAATFNNMFFKHGSYSLPYRQANQIWKLKTKLCDAEMDVWNEAMPSLIFAALRCVCRSKYFVHEGIFAADVESNQLGNFRRAHQPKHSNHGLGRRPLFRVSSVWSGSPRDILISFDSSEILYFCIPPAILGFWRSECVCTSSVILYPWCCGGVSSGILTLWLIWNVFPHVLVYSA